MIFLNSSGESCECLFKVGIKLVFESILLGNLLGELSCLLSMSTFFLVSLLLQVASALFLCSQLPR